MVTEIWVNISSGNGLLPDGTKPLPEPMLTYQYYDDADKDLIFGLFKDGIMIYLLN